MKFTPHYHSIGIATVSIETEPHEQNYMSGVKIFIVLVIIAFLFASYIKRGYIPRKTRERLTNDLNSSDNTTFEHDDNLGI